MLREETMIKTYIKNAAWFILAIVVIVSLVKIVNDMKELTESDERNKARTSVIEAITHDTIEVTKLVHDTVYMNLDGTSVVPPDTTIMIINTPKEFVGKKMLVGYPKMIQKPDMVILEGHGPSFEDVEYFKVGCEGKIYTVDSKPGLQWCTGHWVIRIKETAPAPSMKPVPEPKQEASSNKTLFDGII